MRKPGLRMKFRHSTPGGFIGQASRWLTVLMVGLPSGSARAGEHEDSWRTERSRVNPQARRGGWIVHVTKLKRFHNLFTNIGPVFTCFSQLVATLCSQMRTRPSWVGNTETGSLPDRPQKNPHKETTASWAQRKSKSADSPGRNSEWSQWSAPCPLPSWGRR